MKGRDRFTFYILYVVKSTKVEQGRGSIYADGPGGTYVCHSWQMLTIWAPLSISQCSTLVLYNIMKEPQEGTNRVRAIEIGTEK